MSTISPNDQILKFVLQNAFRLKHDDEDDHGPRRRHLDPVQVAATPASDGKMPSKNKNTDGRRTIGQSQSHLLPQFSPKFRPIYLQNSILSGQGGRSRNERERGSLLLFAQHKHRDIFTFKFLPGKIENCPNVRGF